MMRSAERSQRRARGVSMLETTVACSVLASMALAVGGVMNSTQGLASRTHAELVASEKNRRGLEHIADILRSGSVGSLSGFSGFGVATAPQFNPVVGMAAGAPTLGPATTLQWQAGPACNGVANPGQIMMTAAGVTRCVAQNVPSGGFTVTQSGSSLRIHLQTYAPSSNGETVYATGDTTVALRN